MLPENLSLYIFAFNSPPSVSGSRSRPFLFSQFKLVLTLLFAVGVLGFTAPKSRAAGNPIDSLDVLARSQVRGCDFGDAIRTYGQELLDAAMLYGMDSPEAARCLNGMGEVEYKLGHYRIAERLCRLALAKAERSGEFAYREIMRSCITLSLICRCQRRAVKGKELARRAIEIGKRYQQEIPPEDMAMALVALGWNERLHGGYRLAEESFLEAHAVAQQAYNDQHPICAVVYSHQAALAVNLIDGDRGLLNADRAIAIIERHLGPDHLDAAYAHWYRGRALLYLGRLDEAISESQIASDILTAAISPVHPDIALFTGLRAHCLQVKGDLNQAMQAAWEASAAVIANYESNSLNLDDQSAILASTDAFSAYSGYASMYFDHKSPTPEQSHRLAELVLACKGMTDDIHYTRAALRSTVQNPGARQLLEELASVRAMRSAVFFNDPNKTSRTLRRLSGLRERELDILAQLSALGSEGRAPLSSGVGLLDEVCKRIPPGACVVNYYLYRYEFPVIPPEPYQEEARFGVMVLDSNGILGHWNLRCYNSVLDTIAAMRSRTNVESTRSPSSHRSVARKLDNLAFLYDELWRPFSKAVRSTQMLLISPDANTSHLSFGALYDTAGAFLSERYAIQYLSSPRDLLRMESRQASRGSRFLLADPDFDAPPPERLAAVSDSRKIEKSAPAQTFAVRNVRPVCEQLDSLKAASLPNTRVEAERVQYLWETSASDSVFTFADAAANEEAIKRELPGKRIAHVATHGYHIDVDCRKPEAHTWYEETDPLLTSGLLLAGCNLLGVGAEEVGAEDGILTAEEAAVLNLSQTDLVVLSTCESSDGVTSPGQGTYSLARAFQMAGARQVVGALWSVSDAASIEAMEKIYGSPDKTIAEALQEFAIEKIKADRAAGRETDPFYWAPYVSYGDWRAR